MKAKFTGHDTFSLRYGWLYKAINYLNSGGKLQTSNEESTRKAIVELGVGKNMVNAIRYWGEASSVITMTNKNNVVSHSVSAQGTYLFGSRSVQGKDPYLENSASVWLLHFWLNFNYKHLTAYRYFFNFSNIQHFEKSKLVTDFTDDAQRLVTNEIGIETTLKKDIDCFLSTYCTKFKSTTAKKKFSVDEDHFNSPLAELNLVQDNGGGYYVSNLTDRPDLPIEIFIYALVKFAQVETEDSKIFTVNFDALLSKPYSPGRIFRLSEAGLGQKLDEAQEFTQGAVSWLDSLGLRQVKLTQKTLENPDFYLDELYGAR
ncbi:MAG: DUF4007 family protein [Oceanospirillaceae bacterium]|nr:DUF4007 family protein [Oceanospirillaceae bacterium]